MVPFGTQEGKVEMWDQRKVSKFTIPLGITQNADNVVARRKKRQQQQTEQEVIFTS